MSCNLSLDVEDNVILHDRIVTRSWKRHVCCECGEPIPPKTAHHWINGIYDGRFWVERTCMVCKEIRDKMLSGDYICGSLFEHLNDDCEDINTANVDALSPEARRKFFMFYRDTAREDGE